MMEHRGMTPIMDGPPERLVTELANKKLNETNGI